MFQNMLMSSFTPFGSKKETKHWENKPFITKWPEASSPSPKTKPVEIHKTIKKKAKRIRTAFTTQQLEYLEGIFSEKTYISSEERGVISKRTNLTEKSIKVWFQNRRMREKRKTSECSSDSFIVDTTPSPRVASVESPQSPTPQPLNIRSPGAGDPLPPAVPTSPGAYNPGFPLESEVTYQYTPNGDTSYLNYWENDYVAYPHYGHNQNQVFQDQYVSNQANQQWNCNYSYNIAQEENFVYSKYCDDYLFC